MMRRAMSVAYGERQGLSNNAEHDAARREIPLSRVSTIEHLAKTHMVTWLSFRFPESYGQSYGQKCDAAPSTAPPPRHVATGTNKRRNLTSSQWATVAVEAEELIAAIRVEAEARMKSGVQINPSQLID